ncbi:LOW QUALITY PROTEIN: hypothetical protein HJC23_006899 [Cyclotella cryptica]|uniref:Uncharacterized protein n=1 Tax=Cyclotella cryptica TaxID=29204 RepID=A0ABD3QDD7_9STRA
MGVGDGCGAWWGSDGFMLFGSCGGEWTLLHFIASPPSIGQDLVKIVKQSPEGQAGVGTLTLSHVVE